VSYRACDPNVSASGATSCSLAENVFWALWEQSSGESTDGTIEAYNPVSSSSGAFDCGSGSDTVTCVGTTDASVDVTFSTSAFYAYTRADANAYARSHSVG
jgi:hypothetical protein